MDRRHTPPTTRSFYSANAAGRSNYLVGMVVVLIGNDTPLVRELVTLLVKKGAVIALVSRRFPRISMQRLKESLQSTKQQLMFFDLQDAPPATAEKVMQSIVSALGQVDILIDLSSDDLTSETEQQPEQRDWDLVNAFIYEHLLPDS